MNYYKVEGHSNLVRDPNTNAIINTNKTDYYAYLNQKQNKEKEIKRIEKLESDVTDIKSDLNEIKDLLRNLANGSK